MGNGPNKKSIFRLLFFKYLEKFIENWGKNRSREESSTNEAIVSGMNFIANYGPDYYPSFDSGTNLSSNLADVSPHDHIVSNKPELCSKTLIDPDKDYLKNGETSDQNAYFFS